VVLSRVTSVRTTRLQVRLRDTHPLVLRVLDVPAVSTLTDVHHLLQAAMGWTDSHLHAFDTGATRYGTLGEDDPDEVDETDVPLTVLGASFTYVYDFGDSWEHDVQVLGPGGDRVGCLRAEAACPPEDCGGAPGYEQLCAVLADPTHPEHQDMLTFTTRYPLSDPVPFDPTGVDPVAIDRRVHDTAGQVPAPVRLLLDLADGVKLTPGGRLPRTVVRAVHDQHPSWYDLGRPASIEDDLPPLVALHTLLRQTGLLRVRHGVLHTTKAARDDLTVVRRLRTALPEASFTTLVATTATALLAASGPQTPATLAHRLLPEIGPGWSRGGYPVTEADITTELHRVRSTLQALDQVVADHRTWAPGPSARTLLPRTTLLATLWA
jgi:hypothetical protein